MADEADHVPVVHNAALKRFEVTLDGKLASSKYLLAGGKLVIEHTEVPEDFEGRGIAGRLVKAALEHARAQGLRVLPLCPFAKAYLGRHPEYRELLA